MPDDTLPAAAGNTADRRGSPRPGTAAPSAVGDGDTVLAALTQHLTEATVTVR